MAGLVCTVNIPSTALVGATPTVVGFISTPTNQRVKILGYGFFFDGIVNTNQPVEIKFARPTSVGTLTTGGTAIVADAGLTETPQSTVGIAASSQPTLTASLVYKTITVHPQLGYEFLAPLGDEERIAGATHWVVSINAPVAVDVRGYFRFEE
jgi:hypothetical protein